MTNYQKIEVTVPAPNTLPLSKIASEGMTATRTAVLQALNAAFSKNRILVLPEDAGKGFLKTMAMRSMYLIVLAVTVGLVSWFGFRYWYRTVKTAVSVRPGTGTILLQIVLKSKNYSINWTA